MMDPVQPLPQPDPGGDRPRDRRDRVLAAMHALCVALTGGLTIRAMWINDYATLIPMVVAFVCNGFLLWDQMKDRQ